VITQLQTGPHPVGASDFEVCYETHWWPMVRRGRIYSNLGRASVHVAPWKD